MHLALYFLLCFVFSAVTDASTQLDLSLFREECPCLKAYDVEPVFAYYAYDIDSCVVYCIGVQACEAVNYCVCIFFRKPFLLRSFEKWEELFIRVCAGITINYRNRSSDISYQSPFNRDLNDNFQKKFHSVEDNRFEVFDF